MGQPEPLFPEWSFSQLQNKPPHNSFWVRVCFYVSSAKNPEHPGSACLQSSRPQQHQPGARFRDSGTAHLGTSQSFQFVFKVRSRSGQNHLKQQVKVHLQEGWRKEMVATLCQDIRMQVTKGWALIHLASGWTLGSIPLCAHVTSAYSCYTHPQQH